jgi:alkylhydroperoxidase family enzyme
VTSPRLPFVPEEPADPRVQEVFERMRKRWQGAPVLHLYRLLGWAPSLIGPWMDFAHALRFKTAVAPLLRELMVVRIGQLAQAEYEWKHHWPAAREAGASEAQLQALEAWQGSSLFDDGQRAVLALAEDTGRGHGASKATMDALKAQLPPEQVVELVVIAGFYAGVSRVANSLQVPLEPGFESMTPRDEER